MKKIFLSIFLVLFLATTVSASKYFAPTDDYTNQTFSASSLEIGDVISDGQDLGNTTSVQFSTSDALKLAFKIDSTKDLNLRELKIQFSPDKTVIDKGSSNIDTYTLYVPNSNNGKGIFICPQAKILDEVNKQCSGIKKIFEPFPQTVLSETPVFVEINSGSYSVSGLKSGGIGLLSSEDKPENQTAIAGNSPPSIQLLSPKNSEKISSDFSFRCKAADDKGLRLIELYSNVNGPMSLLSRKPTGNLEDVLEFQQQKPKAGTYSWYCLVLDDISQETKSEIQSFVVEDQPSICAEDWICSPFQPLKCDVGHQTRTCTDKNTCGTVQFKPDEVRDCQSKCQEKWSCTDWSDQRGCGTRTCKDENQCDNSQYQTEKPKEFSECVDQVVDQPTPTSPLILGVIIAVILVLFLFFVLKRKKQIE